MGLQPQGLVGNQRVGSRVGLVETIAGKLFNQVENVFRQGFVDVIVFTAVEKELLLFGHFLGLFLTHGPAQHVGVTKTVAGHHLGNLHDLFLIQDNAIGGLKNGLQPLILIIRMRE